MSLLITVIIVILIVGVIMFLVNNYLPIDPPFKTILNAVVIITLIIWLLYRFSGHLNI